MNKDEQQQETSKTASDKAIHVDALVNCETVEVIDTE